MLIWGCHKSAWKYICANKQTCASLPHHPGNREMSELCWEWLGSHPKSLKSSAHQIPSADGYMEGCMVWMFLEIGERISHITIHTDKRQACGFCCDKWTWNWLKHIFLKFPSSFHSSSFSRQGFCYCCQQAGVGKTQHLFALSVPFRRHSPSHPLHTAMKLIWPDSSHALALSQQ